MIRITKGLIGVLLLLVPTLMAGDEALQEKAQQLARRYIIIDGHVDVPYRIQESGSEDLSQRTKGGDFDLIRARSGGLSAPFMSIYIPAHYQSGGAKDFADKLIDMVEGFQKSWPDKFAVAHSTADVRAQFKKGLISLPLGMENGAPVEGKLENLKHFYERGIRYITLTHGKNNHICDSSYDTEDKWKGLSPFGRKVVWEMNRLGIMVDVSHVSDDTFHQVMELSKAPVIASHSSCRHFTPGFERNMSDDMIKKLGANDGVIMINFGSGFLLSKIRNKRDEGWKAIRSYLETHKLDPNSDEGKAYTQKYFDAQPKTFADVTDVANHIDHVVKLIGVEHVGFGSDFDGVGDSLPTGLKDVSAYPNLIYHLLKRGYSESDIEKICSGNALRVWGQVEKIAANWKKQDSDESTTN